MLTKEELRTLLEYDSVTGKLTWKCRPREMFRAEHEFSRWNTRYAGTAALTAKIDGYPMGHIHGKPYKAHRVIFCMEHGYWPEYVDHINGNRSDNRLENLQASTKVENGRNQKLNTKNTSGHVGVYWYKPSKKWRAMIGVNGKRKYLGQFDTIKDAISAREKANNEHGFSKRHGTA